MKTTFYYPVAGLLLLLLSLRTTWGATSSSPTIETVNGFLSDIEIENVLSQFQGMGRRLGDYGGAENNNVGTFMLGSKHVPVYIYDMYSFLIFPVFVASCYCSVSLTRTWYGGVGVLHRRSYPNPRTE